MMPRAILIGLTIVWAAVCFAMPKPPENAVTLRRGGTIYYSGTVYLNSHEDTVRLKEVGFSDFVFEIRSFSSLKYKARWPQSALNLPMPDFLTGMDYDIAANADPVSDEDTVANTAAAPQHPAHARRYSMWMDTAWAHRFLGQLDVRVRALDRPDHPRPDTVIADRKFTHGIVLMSSLSDTAGLIPFGFFGFEPGGIVYDSSGDDSPAVAYQSCRAYWPKDVYVKELPENIHSIQSDRLHLGQGVVRFKAKKPKQ